MFENGIPGGVSGVFGDRYIESNEDNKIVHIDMNNLYGFAMLQNLPKGNFQIYEKKSITKSFFDKVLKTHDCSNIGYVLLVDLIYPDNIQLKSTNLPFCPENKIIDPKRCTEYMKEHVLNHLHLLVN